MRRSHLVAAVVVLGLIAPSPSPASPAAPHRDGTPSARFDDALMGGDASLGELLRLRRGMLVSPVEQGGSGMIAPALRDDDPCEDVEPSGDGVTVTPLLAVDLDGVAGDEVVTLASPYEPECRIAVSFFLFSRPESITVRSGSDAAPLWTVQTNNLQYVQRAELTGDGIADLLTVEESLTQLYSGVIRTRIRARSGLDGALLWERHYTATIEIASAMLVTVVGVTNMIVGVQTMGEVDGDGVAELLVSRRTSKLALVFPTLSGAGFVVAESVSGLSGESVTTSNATSTYACAAMCTGGFPVVVPAGDVDGDGKADLFVGRSRQAYWSIEATAADGARIWQARLPAYATIVGVAADLTGDGVRDLMVLSFSPLAAFDGVKGTLLWSGERFFGFLSPLSANSGVMLTRDIDGDGGMDFILDVPDASPVVQARSGATATEIWSRRVDPGFVPTPSLWTHYHVVCGAESRCPGVDPTGDGFDDVVVRSEVVEAVHGESQTIDRRLYVVDGRTGTVALDVSDFVRGEHLSIDVDGDGSTDVLSLSNGGHFGPRFFSGSDNALVDAVAYPVGSTNHGALITGNLDGDATADVLLSVTLDDSGRVRTDAISPAGVRWRA